MNREEFNKEWNANIPEYCDIGLDASGYVSARNDKREDAYRNGRKVSPLEDACENFINTVLTYAREMPDSPLMVNDYDVVWLIKKLKIYKKWDVTRAVWENHEILPILKLDGRVIVVERSDKSEQAELFG